VASSTPPLFLRRFDDASLTSARQQKAADIVADAETNASGSTAFNGSGSGW
jgi:hypothetical protein